MIAWLAGVARAEPEGRDVSADGVLEEVTAGGRTVFAHRDGGRTWIGASDGGAERVLVEPGGDRLALSPDGSMVAYVAPRDGVATVWVVPFAGGEPRAVTPPVVRTPGRAPEGFVAPPADRSLVFRADELCWRTPAGGAGASPDTCRRWR